MEQVHNEYLANQSTHPTIHALAFFIPPAGTRGGGHRPGRPPQTLATENPGPNDTGAPGRRPVPGAPVVAVRGGVSCY